MTDNLDLLDEARRVADKWRVTVEDAHRLLQIQQQMAKLNEEAVGIVEPSAEEIKELYDMYSDNDSTDNADILADPLVWGTWEEALSLRDSLWDEHQHHIQEMRKGAAPEEGCRLCEADLRATAEPQADQSPDADAK